jgi:hypothetical protein
MDIANNVADVHFDPQATFAGQDDRDWTGASFIFLVFAAIVAGRPATAGLVTADTY